MQAIQGGGGEVDVVAVWQRILGDPAFEQSPLSFRLAAFNNAANAYRVRRTHSSHPEDLDSAVRLAERAVDALPPQVCDRAEHVNFLAVILLERYCWQSRRKRR